MDEELEAELVDEFPDVFQWMVADSPDDLPTSWDVVPPITADGITCGDGWYLLIRGVTTIISSHNERQGTAEDGVEQPVRVVQVKEKFGRLRIYLNRHPEFLRGATRLAGVLSEGVCEACGATGTTVRRRELPSGWLKTYCKGCYQDELGESVVEVWAFTKPCHECDAEMEVVFPRGLGGTHGGTWEEVGAELADLQHGNVEQTYSEVQETEVWGNICPECGSYQGNYYVYQEFRERLPADPENKVMEPVTILPVSPDGAE